MGRSWSLLGRSWLLLGRSWATLGPLLAALGSLLGRSWALLGSSWGSLGRSWGALDHLRRPKLVQIGLQDAFGNDLKAKTRICKKYWKTFGKTHIFDPKMAPTCRKMAPRSFQEPSWPLLVALGPLLGLLRAILGSLVAIGGASKGDLGEILAVLARSWSPLPLIAALE